ncbi:Mitochondrial protein [Escovopsis weberi]|uniref:Mitochondrial protein n=1 Tax=Escovopsis weberi TaxID=150374 RepID=A0A0M9VVI7_ESCWE|nr:Mitochondrial protein [Escovopsis weberi]
MPNSCQELRDALAQCLQESDCVMVHRNKASDCLREPLVGTLPTHCQRLKKGYGECKRGLVDMRKRFRGNVPVDHTAVEAGADADADAQGKGYQLYAGKRAFAGGVRATSGNEPIPKDWREVENEKYLEMQQKQRETKS